MNKRNTVNHLLVIVLLINFNLTSYSQDFINVRWISQYGDTIHGSIKTKIVEDRFLIAKIDKNIPHTYRLSADEIRSVLYHGDEIFQTVTVFYQGRKTNIFIEEILNGAAPLYRGSCGEMGKLYFIEKDQKIFMIVKKNINEFLKNLLGGCFNVQIIKRDLYIESTIKNAIQLYNTCAHPNTIVNNNPTNRFTPEFYLGGKINYNTGKFSWPGQAHFQHGHYSDISSTGFGISGMMGISKHIFLRTDFCILIESSSADPVITSFDYPYNQDVTSRVEMNFTYLDWPLYLGYYLGNGKIKPFIGAGLDIGFLLSNKLKESPYRLSPIDKGVPEIDFDGLSYGYLGIAGLKCNLNSKSCLHIELNYSFSNSIYVLYRNSDLKSGYGTGSGNLNTSRVEFSLGYIYQFK